MTAAAQGAPPVLTLAALEARPRVQVLSLGEHLVGGRVVSGDEFTMHWPDLAALPRHEQQQRLLSLYLCAPDADPHRPAPALFPYEQATWTALESMAPGHKAQVLKVGAELNGFDGPDPNGAGPGGDSSAQ